MAMTCAPRGAEQLGAELVGGAVGAVQNDAEIGEIGSGDDAGAEEGEVFGVEGFVGDEGGEIGGGEIGARRLNVRGCDGGRDGSGRRRG